MNKNKVTLYMYMKNIWMDSSKNKRINVTLRLSNDLGRTWTKEYVLHYGPSAYSDITKLRNGNIGCLFEAGIKSPYEGIAYKEVDIRD